MGEDVGQLDDGRATLKGCLDLRSTGGETCGRLNVDRDGPVAVGLGVLDEDLLARKLQDGPVDVNEAKPEIDVIPAQRADLTSTRAGGR